MVAFGERPPRASDERDAAQGFFAALAGFVAALPADGAGAADAPALATLDAVLASRVRLSLEHASPPEPEAALALLGAPGPAGCFPTFASTRAQLMAWWFAAVEMRANATTPIARRAARRAHPVPRNIGCPYGGGPGYPGCTYW